MEFWDFAAFATGAGCLTAVVLSVIRSTFGSRGRLGELELRSAIERGDLLERRVADLARQNEQFHQQIEWHGRLIESYERVLGQPTARNGDDRVFAARTRDRD